MIRNLSLSIFFIFTFSLLVSKPASAKEPENLHTLKKEVIFYYDSGEYDFDQEAVVQRAHDYLDMRMNQDTNNQKLAIVFYIDETALSNYQHMLKLTFGMIPQLVVEDIERAEDPAIGATLKLYEYAKDKGVAIFFITGRHEKLRNATQKNLKSVGYNEWDGLYLKPNDYKEKSVIPYKSSTRKRIQEEGYIIVVNIGDQFSDLAGGFAERVFKLPNPYYFIP
jgi:acid phosphatase